MWTSELRDFCDSLNDLDKLKQEWETTFDAFLMHMDQGRLDMYGGYPAQWATTSDCIVMASTDYENAPELSIWTKKEVKEWVEQVIEELAELPEQDRVDHWSDFFHELWPQD